MRVRAGSGRVGACMRGVYVALLIQHAKTMRYFVKFVAPQAPPDLSTLSHNFRGNVTEHKMCVLIFSTTFV
jgi:hypothetical protein